MRTISLITAVLICLAASSPAYAGGDDSSQPFEPVDAQALIDACWADTNSLRASGEAGERESAAYLLECHKANTLTLLGRMFDPDIFSRRDAERLFAKIHVRIGEFYVYIFNAHRKCGCDSDPYATYDLAMAREYERILQHVAYQYNRYEF